MSTVRRLVSDATNLYLQRIGDLVYEHEVTNKREISSAASGHADTSAKSLPSAWDSDQLQFAACYAAVGLCALFALHWCLGCTLAWEVCKVDSEVHKVNESGCSNVANFRATIVRIVSLLFLVAYVFLYFFIKDYFKRSG